MEARPNSFRYGFSSTVSVEATQVRLLVPYNRVTFIKAVAVNLPRTGQWSQQVHSDSILVVARSAVEQSTMVLNGFISTVFLSIVAWILSDAAHPHKTLTLTGLSAVISLLFAAVIPCIFTLLFRRDRRAVAELIETDGSTEIFLEPCEDEALDLYIRSVVTALTELHDRAATPLESEQPQAI